MESSDARTNKKRSKSLIVMIRRKKVEKERFVRKIRFPPGYTSSLTLKQRAKKPET